MINVEWRNVARGYDYKKYLQRQVQDVLDDCKSLEDGKMAYYSKAGEFTVDGLTRISGGLADRYGLAGAADLKKLAEIANMETGEHPDVAASLEIKTKKRYLVAFDGGKEAEVGKDDIERGWTKIDGKRVRFEKSQVREEVSVNRRSSLELVFSLDKSFSYLFFSDLLNGEQKKALQEIMFESQREAMEKIISPMLATADGQKGEMLFYDFMHLDNRENDPHLHIHSNISNLIRLPDGRFKAVEPGELFSRGTAERVDFQFKSIFLAKLRERLPEIPVEAYGKDLRKVSHEYALEEVKDFRVAFDDESRKAIRAKCDHAGKIKEAIDLDKRNLYQLNQKKLAAVKSMFDKGEITDNAYLDAVSDLNRNYAKDYDYLNSRKYDKIVQRKLVASKKIRSLHETQDDLTGKAAEMALRLKQPEEASRALPSDSEILRLLTDRNPIFGRNDLIRDLAKYRGLGVEAEAEADRILASDPDVFAFSADPKSFGEAGRQSFTLRSLAATEKENLDLVERIRDRFWESTTGTGYLIEKAELRGGITFKEEQKEYIRKVFKGFGVSIIVGLPGTGKSFAMAQAAAMARSISISTFGLAPTGKVVGAIAREAGTDYAATIDKFLIEAEAGKVVPKKDDIVFVDEAGMIGTRNYNRLLKIIESSGAKLVLIGDNNQLDPVQAGSTFNEIVKRHAGKEYATILSEISRQKDETALKLAKAVSGKASMEKGGGSRSEQLSRWQTDRLSAEHAMDAFRIMEESKLVSLFDTEGDMLGEAVRQYLSDSRECGDKLMLASSNKTVDRLNSAIRDARLASGELGEGLEANGEVFRIGDRLAVQKNGKEAKNGDIGTIAGITKGGRLVVDFDGDGRKEIDPEAADARLGYAMTVHKSQGLTKKATWHIGENSSLNDAQLFNVAATRNTHDYRFLSVECEYAKVKESYCRASGKASLMELGEFMEKAAKPSPAPLRKRIAAKRRKIASFEARTDTTGWINGFNPADPLAFTAFVSKCPTLSETAVRISRHAGWKLRRAAAWVGKAVVEFMKSDAFPHLDPNFMERTVAYVAYRKAKVERLVAVPEPKRKAGDYDYDSDSWAAKRNSLEREAKRALPERKPPYPLIIHSSEPDASAASSPSASPPAAPNVEPARKPALTNEQLRAKRRKESGLAL